MSIQKKDSKRQKADSDVLRLLAFSDWRIQNIDNLSEYLQELDEKPDLIIYAGDDIDRFNKVQDKHLPKLFRRIYLEYVPDKNYFQELAGYSKYGLLAIAGNDDFPFIVHAIHGKKVNDIYKKPFVIGDYVFIGIEGSTSPPGTLLHSEDEVMKKLNESLDNFSDKRYIIVSHTPPYGILDIGIRFGTGHIGSVSLRRFIDKNYKRIKMIFCGHAHSQGGKSILHKGITVINCASHDSEGSPGKVCTVVMSKEMDIKWDHIHEWGIIEKEIDELMRIPLVGHKRASALFEIGVKSIEQLAALDFEEISEYRCFNRSIFYLVKNYARAIHLNKPIVKGRHPFFKRKRNIYFFDAEYDPVGTRNGPYGIFLIGIMDRNGNVKQSFLDNPNDEKKMLKVFQKWLTKERPKLVAYSSTSADKPQLINAFERFNISADKLETSFFDLYYDCINTQQEDKQFVFLPMKGSMGAKQISNILGYREPKDLRIRDGLEALIEYSRFLKKKNERIKRDLLKYNEVDLERTRFVFEYIKDLFK